MKFCCSIFFLIAFTFKGYSQDPLFSQFFSTKLYTNPAFAGLSNKTIFTGAYRNQWSSVNNAFQTNYFSAETKLSQLNSGIGLSFIQDRIASGIFKSSYISLYYAYHVKIFPKLNFSFGFSPSYFEQTFDWSNATWGDQINSTRGFVYSSQQPLYRNKVNVFDFSSGGILYSKYFYTGFSLQHLYSTNRGYLTDDIMHRKISFVLGGNFENNQLEQNRVSFSPNIIYQKQQNHQYINIGLYTTLNKLTLGVWVRNKNALILLVGIRAKKINIGYSVDFPLTTLMQSSPYGSHEVTLSLALKNKKRTPKFRTISCPEF